MPVFGMHLFFLSSPHYPSTSMPSASPWFEMPSPFDSDGGRVLMLEPPGACAEALRSQLLDETYAKPYVMDDGERRFLHFNGRLIQSAMRLAEPNDLDLRYTQKMMSFLLFRPRPRRLLLIGLGGGSLVKFCHYRLPATHMTVLENNPDVIALQEAFLVPPDGPNLKVLEADGAAYLEQTEKGSTCCWWMPSTVPVSPPASPFGNSSNRPAPSSREEACWWLIWRETQRPARG